LISDVGIAIVQAVEDSYRKFKESPNEKNAKTYQKWRFRLHQRLENNKDLLDAINDARTLGLYDETPGKTYWDCDFG
jgi:hypothetical protein